MKTIVVTVTMMMALAGIAQAGITSVTCPQDNDGALTMDQFKDVTWDPATEILKVNEIQNWNPGHIFPTFLAEGDPYAWILKDVENQTDFSWTGYHFNVYMPNTFGIVSSAQPLGWTVQVTQPTLENDVIIDGVNVGSRYHGALDFFVGTGSAIPVGQTAEFGARLFWPSGNGNFCVEQIALPEPTSLVLLALGGLLLRRR
jgi:hypothetical protein